MYLKECMKLLLNTSISFMGKIEPTKMTWLPMCGFIAQLIEHRTGPCTGIRGGHGEMRPGRQRKCR